MKHTGFLCLLLLVFLTGCTEASVPADAPSPVQVEEIEITTQEDESVESELILMVNDTAVPVLWEDNASVAELKEAADRQPLQIEMSPYGGWEQVGSLGHSLPRNDVQITARNGDIMLYSGSQIVLFYGNNSWAYTKLGHIDLPEEEVTALLSNEAVSITLTTGK